MSTAMALGTVSNKVSIVAEGQKHADPAALNWGAGSTSPTPDDIKLNSTLLVSMASKKEASSAAVTLIHLRKKGNFDLVFVVNKTS